MRGRRDPQASMLAFVDVEERIPRDHALRLIKVFAETELTEHLRVSDQMQAVDGRPSIRPERLLKTSLLIALCSVRSERACREERDYHLLFRLVSPREAEPVEPRRHHLHQELTAGASARGGAAVL
jgi:transposase